MSAPDPTRPIVLPPMCARHRALLLRQAGIGRTGPWRVALVVSEIALFQGVTAHPSTPARIGGDLHRVAELGCLACDRPDVFGQVVDALQREGFAGVKALGERLVREVAQP